MPSPNSGLVTRNVPKVTGGVSQRSSVVRDTSQCTELINGYPDSTFGMSRRPASTFNTALETFNENHYLYTFSFSPTEKYALFVKNGGLTVVDLLNKQEMDVNVETNAEDYLASSDPARDFQAMTVGNETFIMNRAITVAQDDTTESDEDVPTGIVWVRLGDFGTNYGITLDGTEYGLTITASHREYIDTHNIAFCLWSYIPQGFSLSTVTLAGTFHDNETITLTDTTTGRTHTVTVGRSAFNDPDTTTPNVPTLNGMIRTLGADSFFNPASQFNGHPYYFFLGADNTMIITQFTPALFNFTCTTNSTGGVCQVTNYGLLPATYEATVNGSTITIRKADDSDFTLGTKDGLGDQALEAVKGTVQSFANLPLVAEEGFKIHVTGELLSEVDDFYVEYDTSDSPAPNGVWRESLKGGELTSLDATTMPHVLVPDGSGGWDFQKAEWNPRAVGDLTTNPMPSIVGKTLDDMFFFKNRLGFVSGESRVMSQSGEYFNLFRKSVSQLFDSERIDVASNSQGINHINFATFQDSELILWGDKGQIAVTGTPLLTPKTIAEDPAGAFKTSPDAKPVQSGKFSYFLTERNGRTQVSEYFTVDAAKPRKEVVDITEEIPTYINTTPLKVEAVPEMGVVFVQGEVEEID